MGEGWTFRFHEFPHFRLRIERENLIRRNDIARQPCNKVDSLFAANKGMLGPDSWVFPFYLNLFPVELLLFIVEVDGIEIAHHSVEDLVPAVDVEPRVRGSVLVVEGAAAAIASDG